MSKTEQSRFREVIDEIILFHNALIKADESQWEAILDVLDPNNRDNLDLERFNENVSILSSYLEDLDIIRNYQEVTDDT